MLIHLGNCCLFLKPWFKKLLNLIILMLEEIRVDLQSSAWGRTPLLKIAIFLFERYLIFWYIPNYSKNIWFEMKVQNLSNIWLHMCQIELQNLGTVKKVVAFTWTPPKLINQLNTSRWVCWGWGLSLTNSGKYGPLTSTWCQPLGLTCPRQEVTTSITPNMPQAGGYHLCNI